MKIKLDNPYYNIEHSFLEEDIEALRKEEFTDAFIRRRVPFFMDGYRYAHRAVKKRWGIDTFFFEAGKKQVKRVYLSQSLNKKAAEIWWKRMSEEEDFAQNIIDEVRGIIDIEKKLARSVPKDNTKVEDLEKYIVKHLNWWVDFFEIAWLWFCVDNIKVKVDKLVKSSWQGSEDESRAFLEKVYRPKKSPFSSVEQRDLLGIYKLTGDVRKKVLRDHWNKYKHLSLHNIDDEYFNLNYYQDRLDSLGGDGEYKKQKKMLDNADSEMKQADRLIENVDLSEKLKEKVEFVRWFMYLRTETIDHFMLVNGAFKPVFESLSHIFDFPVDAVLHMTYKEIISSLRKGSLSVSRELILERTKNGYAFLIAPNGSYLVTGKEIDELFDIVIPKCDVKEADNIKGQTAYRGKATAKARVIIDRREAHELREGEILITTMTSPEFVPAMKISSGIITNEGGILCHAAIMSREFRKPCVIGTKNATDIIKTGQLITLDADNGIIHLNNL